MDKDSKIYVDGHHGLVGSGIYRHVQAEDYNNLITRTHAELDLECQAEVEAFFLAERLERVSGRCQDGWNMVQLHVFCGIHLPQFGHPDQCDPSVLEGRG